jgi:hypothetical protein
LENGQNIDNDEEELPIELDHEETSKREQMIGGSISAALREIGKMKMNSKFENSKTNLHDMNELITKVIRNEGDLI